MNGNELLYIFNKMLENSAETVRDYPYFTAEEVEKLLSFVGGIETPIRWSIWKWDAVFDSVTPDVAGGTTANLRSASDEYQVKYKDRVEFKTLSVASALSKVYLLASAEMVILEYSDSDWFGQDEYEEWGDEGAYRQKEGGEYPAWWYVAQRLIKQNPELITKHFPDLY